MAAFDFAVIAGRIGVNQFVTDAQSGGRGFKERLLAAIFDREAVGELCTVVGLNALDFDTVAGIPGDGLLQEVGGGKRAMLLVGSQITQAGELVDGGVLIKSQTRAGDTVARNDLDIDLYTLARMRHLLVRLGDVLLFLLYCREHTESM